MSANQSSSSADLRQTPGLQPPVSSVLILSNDPARALAVEQALAKSSCSGATIHRGTLRTGFGLSGNEHPELVVLDAQDPGMDPLHELKRVRSIITEIPLILLHTTTDALVASRALRAGAIAFLATSELPALLVTAIDKAAHGERFVSEEVMQGILHGMTENPEGGTRVPIEVLSDREMMVFQLLGKGKCPRNIAEELGVNIKTVATHCNNIRRKLHTPDNRHLTRISHDWAEGRLGSGNSDPHTAHR